MLQASELRKQKIFQFRQEPYKVLDYKHTHMGRGSGDVRVKIKGLISGNVVSCNFSPDERFEEIILTRKKMQYLYSGQDGVYFMDQKSYEQQVIPLDVIGMSKSYLIEGETVEINYWDEQPLGVNLPASMVFKVIEAEPGAKGNSAVNIFKPVIIETGLQVKAPLFIGVGDKIKVNTETGEYISKG